MKKGDRPNQGEELLYHLSYQPGFQRDLLIVRKHLGIPEEGYSDEELRKKWLKDNNALDLLAVSLNLQKKYKISVAYINYLDDYIFFGEISDSLKKRQEPCVVLERYSHRKDVDYGNIEEFYKETGEPYVKLFVLGNSSKSDVLDYINENWGAIEDILAEQRGGKRRVVRKTIFKERNQEIKKWWRRPIQELRKEADRVFPEKAPHASKYKELLIRKIMSKKYGKISEGYIRKIGSTE